MLTDNLLWKPPAVFGEQVVFSMLLKLSIWAATADWGWLVLYAYLIIFHIFVGVMMKRTILSILLMLICMVASAQGSCVVSGVVVDGNDEPVPYASVAAYDAGKLVTGALSDDSGRFTFKVGRGTDAMILVVEFIGYTRTETNFTPDKAAVNLGRIIIREDAVLLGEAIVSAKAEAAKLTVEHTVINASANIGADKGTALDILSTSSSVTVMNDAVSIRGNSNILVLMDGVPTTVSDLAAIPAANIRNIEIITSPDASYDSEGTGGIINIVSKKNLSKGFSGVVSANYGFNHFVTGNIALSYVRPKASWRFSYNTRYEDDVINTTLDRLVHASGNRTYQQMSAVKTVYNNNIGLGADFKLNKKNNLSVDLKFILPRNNVRQDLHNRFIRDGVESEEDRHNDVTWNRENVEGSLAYRHVFKPEVSDLTVKGSVSKIWGHRPSYYFLEGQEVNRSNSGGSPFITSLQADYKHKFKAGTLTAGAKLTYRSNDIFHQFNEWDGFAWQYSETFSNDLLHTELVPAAYALWGSKIGKKFTYKAGLRGEFSTVSLTSGHEQLSDRRNDFFLSPSLSGTYALSSAQDLSLAFTRRIGRPAYPQLNPYMSMVDASTYEQGNMHLRSEKASKVDLSYNLRTRYVQLFADLYMNHTKDYISQVTRMSEGLLITTYINGSSDLKAGAEVSLKLMPAKWVSATLSANTFHVDTRGSFEGAEINNRGWSNNSNLLLDFMAGKTTDIQLQYFVTTPQYYPQLTTALTHQMNAGLKQKFLKGAMTLSLLVTDVFNTYRWQVYSSNSLFDLQNISTRKSRMLWIGLSYNFNSFKQKAAQKKQEDDRSLIRLSL